MKNDLCTRRVSHSVHSFFNIYVYIFVIRLKDPSSIKCLPLSVLTVYIFVICPCAPKNIQYIVLSTEFAFFLEIFPIDPLLLLIYCLIYFSLFVGVLCLSLFCYALFCVHSCFAIIWKRKRKLVVLLYCLTDVLLL